MELKLLFLGSFIALLDGRSLAKLRKVQALLIYLAVESKQAHRRDFLMELLWPGLPQPSAQVNLRQTIHRLNQAIPMLAAREPDSLHGTKTVPLLLSDRQTVQINPDGAYELDVATFTALIKEGTPEKLTQAVALYRGAFLADFYLPDSSIFEEWAAAWRASLHHQVLEALDRLTTTHSQRGAYAAAIGTARRQLEIDNLRESAHRQLMMALAHSGQRSEALAQYETCRRLLKAELGVEPSSPTQVLYERLARDEPLLGMPVTATPPERYHLDQEIGRGAVGIVYRAHDTLLDRPVAIKVLSPGALGTEGRARLLREAQAVAKLSHPNIVPVYDAGERDGSPFIVMELIEGQSLRDAFPPASPLSPLPSLLAIARQVCAALAHAHAHSIIHRDLKPENVLLTPDGTAKLMDFGLAHSAVAPRLTAEGAIVGTPAYLAPEIALDQAIDGRADLYALGVMLYELTTGRLPFSGDDILAIISQHLHAPITPASAHNPEIPAALDALIGQLMSKQPADRPASATAVLQALDELGKMIERQPDATLLPHHLTPPPLTGALYERLAGGEASEVAAGPGAIGQLGASERPRHNLPLQLSSFVGREQEQAEVGRLLVTSRLVTLTGPGGCGKTRLALQVAAQVKETFAYGAWFVELASLADPALLLQAVAAALGVREEQARPLLTTLLAFLRQKQLLLLLDNCEHLLEACAQLADTLLRHCPQLVILATSREALNIAGELAWAVPPLSLPDLQLRGLADNPMQYDAIRLFIERAAAAVPTLMLAGQNDVTTITEVCHRLDGLPLAIELAAARVKTFTVAQIASRLEPRFHLLTGGSRAALPRQQTLQATINWSYNLLPPLEQTLFRRLSVFAGGWTLEAAEAVCSGGNIQQEEVAALLAHLVNASLVVLNRQERYRILETVRQFAQEKLVETGAEAEVRRRHLAYFMKLAEQADLAGPDQMVWINRLQKEMDNFRAALAWSQEDQLEARLRLATALGLMTSPVHDLILFDISYHSLEELAKRLSQLLSQPGAAPRTAVRAKALLAAAGLRDVIADYAHTGALAEESLAIYQELGNKHGEALSLLQLARAVSNMGDNVVSQSLTLESLSLFRALKDRKTVVEILIWMGAYIMKNDSQGQRYLEEALAICREQGDLLGVIQTLNHLGQWALFRGDFSLAHASLEESRTLQRSLGRPDIPVFLHLYGRLALYQGNYLQASAYLEQCLAIQRDHGETEGDPWLLADLGYVALRLGEQGQARTIFAGVHRRFQEMGVKIGIVFALEGLASLAVAQSRPARAVRLFAWADAMRDTIGDTRPPVEQANVDRDLAAIQAHLDAGAIAAAVADGRAMTIEQVIAYALEE